MDALGLPLPAVTAREAIAFTLLALFIVTGAGVQYHQDSVQAAPHSCTNPR